MKLRNIQFKLNLPLMFQKTKGFTLVELLVVMAIIAFLTVGSFAGLTFGLRQARDTQRKQMVDTLNTAVNAYYSDFNEFPSPGSTAWMSGTATLGSVYKANNAFKGPSSTGDGLTSKTGKAGIADYLDGTFNWGPIDKTTADSFIGYYYNLPTGSTKANSYGICISLENKNGGNAARVTAFGTSPAGTKDCYCLGNDTSTFACNGVNAL